MKVLFMGRKEVAARALRVAAATTGVEITGVMTDSHLDVSPTADAARELQIPLFDYEGAVAAVERGDLDFELGISMLYWRKIKPPLLIKPLQGIVNFHPAPLPDFKGVGGYNLAILEGRDNWGASAHYIDGQIDTGEIIAIEPVELDADTDTVVSLEKRTNAALLSLFEKLWPKLTGSAERLPTSANEGGRHLSRRQLEEMKRIDFGCDDIERKVRAFWFPPYDGAYVEVNGRRYTLVSRTILDQLGDPMASSLFSSAATE